MIPRIPTPWDNRNGWLGVKYQITYLPRIPFTPISTADELKELKDYTISLSKN